MAEFSNAQKLASIISEWARPAIAQVASSKMSSMGWVQSLQGSIMSLGLVGSSYNIASDLQPLMMPIINAVIEPMLTDQFRRIPDTAIPQMARDIVDEIAMNGSLSLLDGLVVLEHKDISELRSLIEKNLPCDNVERFNIVR